MADLVAALLLIPVSMADPVFHACVLSAARREEVVAEFQRLSGLEQIDSAFARGFIGFVHECIYTRLDAQALAELRACVAGQEVIHG